MKKLGWAVLALAALGMPAGAADLPARMPVKAPILVPVWNWTGFYVGGNVGYSWGKSDTHVDYFNPVTGLPIAPPAGSTTDSKFNLNGAIGGGQFGYNWQSSNWVWGLETDIQWSGQKGSTNFLCSVVNPNVPGACLGSTFVPAGVTGSTLSLNQKLEWFGTLRGRLGATVTPDILVYATGGLAYGEIKSDGTLTGPNAGGVLVGTPFSQSSTKAGWTVGAGLEGHITGNWTGKIEYLYMDLGRVSGTVANTPASIGANYSSKITDNILRVGINYKF